jgi:hypothetical protein
MTALRFSENRESSPPALPRTQRWLEDCRRHEAVEAKQSPHATIPHNEFGQPNLQALVRQCGGYDKITPELWAASDRATAEWQASRRVQLNLPSPVRSRRQQ